MINLAVIPVAGRGIDLLPLTKSQPKEMLPVGNKPIVQHVAEELVDNGVNRLLFVTGAGKAAIENHFDEDPELVRYLRYNGKEDLLNTLAFERGIARYFYIRQRRQLGLGHAVLCSEPVVQDQNFIVALGDTIVGLHHRATIIRRMVERFEKENGNVKAVIAFDKIPREDVVGYGIAATSSPEADCFELEDLIEKPTVEEAPSSLAVAARYVFTPDIFDCLAQTGPGINGNIQLTDAIRILIRSGHRVLGMHLTPQETRYDIGSIKSYYHAMYDAITGDCAIPKESQ